MHTSSRSSDDEIPSSVSEPVAGNGRTIGLRSDMLVLAHDADMSTSHRAMYDRFVAESGRDENDVTQVRISEQRVEVDVVDFADARLPVRTVVVDLAASRQTSP